LKQGQNSSPFNTAKGSPRGSFGGLEFKEEEKHVGIREDVELVT